MKVHNPSTIDIAEIPILNGDPVQLKAGETMECTAYLGKWMLQTWGFLKEVPDEPKAVAPVEGAKAEVPAEPVAEIKPKKAKKGNK